MLTITFEDTTQISALAPFGTVFINAALAKNPPAVSVMAYGDERDAILEKMPALAETGGAVTLVLKDEAAQAFVERIDLLT